MKIDLDKRISREALETFQKWHKNGIRTPRETCEALNSLLDEGCIDQDEYDALVLSNWRELDAADPDGYRTREEIAAEAVRREELDCAFTELATARGRIESIIAKSLARIGGEFELDRMVLWAHVFNGKACDGTAHQVYSLYTAANGNVYATFCDCQDLPFFENCTEADLMTLADLLVKA